MSMISKYDAQGRYLCVCAATVPNPNAPPPPPEPNPDVAGVYEGAANLHTQYHDIASGMPVYIPAKPSPNHQFNYTTKQWEDPRTLADLKAEKWRNIKANRDAAEHGGFTWDGSVFDSDALSQQRITGAVTLAQMSPAFTTVWTLKDNSTRTLSAADMFAVGVALGVHVSAQFLQGQLLRAQIDEAATAQEVEAIHW